MIFSINGGDVSFGENTILSDISFEIRNNEKVAVVGRNGSGKTTLLKLIASDPEVLEAFNGEKDSFAGDVTVGYLQQMAFDSDDVTLEDELMKAFASVLDMKSELEALAAKMESSPSDEDIEKYTSLEQHFGLLGGYYWQREYESVLKNFGFTQEDKKKKLNEFSGGQRTRIAFVKLLLSKPDILLLDEPTNHLDINTVEWLEEYLKTYPKAAIIVSHDRMFLDNTVECVYEIERTRLKKYSGNYTKYWKLKQEAYEKQRKDYIQQQKQIVKTEALIDRFRYKKNKAAFAQSKIKYLEHMDKIEAPQKFDLKAFYSDISPMTQSGNDVLDVSDLSIGYGEPLATVSFKMTRGQKLGVIGANGIGKSTLLKTLVGKIPALGGYYLYGTNVQTGYFDQQLAEPKGNINVLDDYWNTFPALSHQEARDDLGAFLFSGEDVFKPVNVLSGGEKVRLALCKIFKRKPNMLILDEPTNHTDIVGREALEEMLCGYEGTVICVSHDSYFINRLCDSLLVFEDGKAAYYPFGYDKYKEMKRLAAKKEEAVPVQAPPKENRPKPVYDKKSGSPKKELDKVQARLKKCEAAVAEKEKTVESVKAELESPEVASDYIKLQELSALLEEEENSLAALMDEWMQLSEREAELSELVYG